MYSHALLGSGITHTLGKNLPGSPRRATIPTQWTGELTAREIAKKAQAQRAQVSNSVAQVKLLVASVTRHPYCRRRKGVPNFECRHVVICSLSGDPCYLRYEVVGN